jgi:hypothetical protein
MGYQINRQSDSRWSILDDDGQLLFEGSLNACEAWLDQQESASQKSWIESIRSFFKKNALQTTPIANEASLADSHSSFRITG